jgi:hypothetical protein
MKRTRVVITDQRCNWGLLTMVNKTYFFQNLKDTPGTMHGRKKLILEHLDLCRRILQQILIEGFSYSFKTLYGEHKFYILYKLRNARCSSSIFFFFLKLFYADMTSYF